MFGKRRKPSGFGLHIQDHQIKLAALSGSGSRIKVRRVHSAALPEGVIKEGRILDEDAVLGTLRQAVQSMGARGSRTVLTIPTSSVVMRRSTMPRMNDRELRNMIDVELNGGSTQLPFKNPVFDFARAGENEDGTDVIIFATPEETVHQYAGMARNAGLVPVAVDLAPLSLLRLLHRALDAARAKLPERFMILHVESETVEASIHVGGYPAFFRSIPVQLRSLLDEDTDYMEAYGRYLSVELARVINYYKYSVDPDEEAGIDMLFLAGEQHFADGLVPVLSREFSCTVQTLDLSTIVNAHVPDIASYAVPIGLALKGA